MQLLDQNLKAITIPNDVGDTVQHVLNSDMINAVNAALAVNRPLLIWGEPGIGKSQLAKAVAKQLERPFLHFVADARTESRDLLWHFDAVARLAEAQIDHGRQTNTTDELDDPLAIEKFIVPGPLWWALNWESAETVAEHSQHKQPECSDRTIANGVVVLIDEIDKADSDVPNGLLEALGSNRFQPQGMDQVVECSGERPLVMITTNEERSLPDAFLRRCLSLHLSFPKDNNQQQDFLVERAEQNAQHFLALTLEDFQQAAQMLVEDRQEAQANHLYPLPGQAEYFDLLRGLQRQSEATGKSPLQLIDQLRTYIYQKHSGFHATR
ncbi:MAG: MoxR family ATPase [Methylococcales bacterium]